MQLIANISLDQIIIAFIATAGVREMLPMLLPASVAGPEGWLVRLDRND